MREKLWTLYNEPGDFRRIGEEMGIDPVMAKIVVNRGQNTPEKREKYLYGTLEDIPGPELLLHCSEAAALLEEKIRGGKSIRIVSDYDVDGVTSNYVLYEALKRLGAVVSYDIPDRIADGYGMNLRIVEEAYRDGVDTILTCDNGIAAFPAVSRAKELGMTVIVTDHHQVQDHLPEADLVIDPWQPGCPYPFKDICGVEVAYKLMRLLSERMGKPLGRDEYLEYVALGTVCDVMPITEENRIIVREGMRVMAETTNVGLRALIRENGLEGKKINVGHLGFIIGPSINSEGRLSSAKEAMKLLLMEDPEEAARVATDVRELNETRKSATNQGTRWVIDYLQASGMGERDRVIVLHVPGLHESLAGIVAGKVREVYYKPVIILTDAENDPDMVKGSARSIEAYNIFEALSEVSGILRSFGGHKAAAGLGLKREDVDRLRSELNARCTLTEPEMTEKVRVDTRMPLAYATVDLVDHLEMLEPFGMGNPKPLFTELNAKLVQVKTFPSGKVLKLILMDSQGRRFEVTTFQVEEVQDAIKRWSDEEECDKMKKNLQIDILYTLGINDYRGREVEFTLQDIRKSRTQD